MINISHFIFHPQPGRFVLLLLYVGPDQVMPLLSVLGAAIGVVLMWWRRLVVLTRRALKSFARKSETSTKNAD